MPIASAMGMRPDPSLVWTCPFCPLLCDDRPASATGCALAEAGLRQTAAPSGVAGAPRIDGQPATLESALAAAVQRLARSRQPLIGGWGTDVAGARALTTLAELSGACCDAAAGEPLSQSLRAQQDRGGYSTTLAEVREHADLIVVLGSGLLSRAPRWLERVLDGRTTPPQIVYLDAPGDLPDTLVRLHLLVAGKSPAAAEALAYPALATLAAQLKAARYTVLVWEPSQLGPHAALCIERLMQLIQRLNQTTRAAALPIGGGDGAMTAQYVHAWRTGLPLRSRHGPRGLEHDPLRFGAQRLLEDGAVDLLLWVASFPGLVAGGVPAATGLPRIVLGLPALAAQLGDERHTVFIPVATPGVHTDGHLFRADGVVLMPLHALQDNDLPTVGAVVEVLMQALAPGRAAA
ncbi:formylmethanofuran dehydrogenase [uncultured Sphaerotilus sp.]|uniref:formylmethanofuran dehydrogenase n=1 Tax=uncultured Sphaerotilus sp. TaxID=474984 RepID=UPI0030CA597E